MCDRLWSMAYIELRNIEVYIYAQGEVLAADFLSQFCLVGSMTLPTNSGTSFTLSLMMKRKGLSTWSSAVLMNAERGTNSMPVAKDISYNARPIHLRKRGPLLPLQKSYMKAVRQHASHSSGDWLPTCECDVAWLPGLLSNHSNGKGKQIDSRASPLRVVTPIAWLFLLLYFSS